ncbi:hypothetical protein M2137_001632 [Parabacteroides sp. PFB2-10]|uniref:DUF3836 domain-containing protein n=1 Tax=Parabacteroides sp. PFB2-10 TaxID=1742405 RepID=UPI00247410F2|nr:DUF3836 domain-containing protein [Parabacteroides sp. PFB2-10]MDH6312847.1 hypothetical protein [Parabacteroides sp. PFB2-10]
MKKSVFTIVLISMFVVSFASSASVKSTSLPPFLYNTSTVEGKIVSKEVCKQMETGDFKRHLRYDYTYTPQGMRASCKASRWNNQTHAWENWYLITYTYDEIFNKATLDYAEWNKGNQAFDAPKEKAVYQYTADSSLLSYAQYEKKTVEDSWQVKMQFGLNSYLVSQLEN